MRSIVLALSVVLGMLVVGCAPTQTKVTEAPEFVPAYLDAPYEDAKAVEKKLKAAGLEVLGVAKKIGKEKLTTIVFANSDARTLAMGADRESLLGAMRAMINDKKKTLRITNPLFWYRGFLQNDFTWGDHASMEKAITSAFATTPSKAGFKFEQLAFYQYTPVHPPYQTLDIVGEEASMEALLSKLKSKAKKNLVYLEKISDTNYIAGVRASKRMEKFVDKIGNENALLVPFPVVLREVQKDGKTIAQASIHPGEYYFAMFWPGLGMGTFMTVATKPGEMKSNIKRYFK